MAASKYLKAPQAGDLRQYTELELRKVERAISDLWLPLVWTPVTFLGAWVNFGGAFTGAAYTKDTSNRVHVRGMVKNGALGTSVFTLPVGYRPSGTLVFAQMANPDALIRVDVTSAGAVIPQTTGAATNVYVALNFSFDPS